MDDDFFLDLDSRVRMGPALTLSEYRALIAATPRPTAKQVDAFVEHAVYAHSWYKHLPLLPPGTRFMLFIDPGKYRCHEIRGDGEIVTEDTANADYAEALSRESHLTAATENAFQHYASVNDIPFQPGRPFIWDAGAYRHLPAEVIDAASIELTAVISPELADQTWVIRRAARAIKAHANAWPEETGGRDTVARLLALIEMTEKGEPVDRADFEALLQPERERLIGNLKITIAALCDLVYA